MAKIADHERNCFLERLQIDSDQLQTYNVVERPQIRWQDVAEAEVVLIGGAAAHSVTEDYPFTEPLADVVRELVERDRPLFGSCWGHQFVAKVLGGEVITDDAAEEVGTFDIHLTEEGRQDPIFAGCPDVFPAHMGHKDRVSKLPPGGIELGYSHLCRVQLYRLADKPVYGAQFHAEMTAERLVERISFYRDSYMPCDDAFEALRQRQTPTPEVDSLLHRFLELVE